MIVVTKGDRRNQEMTYDNKNCDDDGDTFDPVDRRLAIRKRRPEILEQAERQ